MPQSFTATGTTFRPARRRVAQVIAHGAVPHASNPGRRAEQATQSASSDAETATPEGIAVSGGAVPALAAFDDVMRRAMATWAIPGGQLSLAKDDRLVYSRGFGYASLEDNEPVAPTHRFRIASCTKGITGVGILSLVDAGKLALATPVFHLLGLDGPTDAPFDPRLNAITVQDLLVHAGGWDSAGTGFDPQYMPWPVLVSHVLGDASPASPETIVRYMQSHPLDFDPGTKSSYSNFGFNVLGRVIERVSGQPYEVWMQQHLFAQAGITSMAIGGTRLADRMPDEVRYYHQPELQPGPSVYPGEGFVPPAYGTFYLRALDAHGGYIATSDDLIRFLLAMDGTRGPALLTPQAIGVMQSTARPPLIHPSPDYPMDRGLAWDTVALADGGYSWSHPGALLGSNGSWMYRDTVRGVALALSFNTLPGAYQYHTFFDDLMASMQGAIAAVASWPDTDLFT